MKLAHIGGIEKSLAWGEDYFERHGGITVFFARWLPGLRIFGAWIAGMVHMKWWKFALWNAAGGIAWTTSIVLLGHFFGKSIHVVERVLGIGGVIALVVVAVALLVLWRRHEKAQGRHASNRFKELCRGVERALGHAPGQRELNARARPPGSVTASITAGTASTRAQIRTSSKRSYSRSDAALELRPSASISLPYELAAERTSSAVSPSAHSGR